MSFLVVENNRCELDNLTELIQQANPGVKVISIPSGEEVFNLESQNFDLAFINPELEQGKMTGLDLAMHIKKINHDSHVIFIANNKNYTWEALLVHADAYLLKPVSEDDIRREVNYATYHYPSPLKTHGKVFIRTFGGFDVFVDDEILKFERGLAKELLALLVDRRGVALSAREACGFLWEGAPYDTLHNGYYHVVVTSLTQTLAAAGISKILRKTRKHLAINPKMFDCDAYRYLRGDVSAIRNYNGNYLSGYKWAGYATKLLEKLRSEEECPISKKKSNRRSS